MERKIKTTEDLIKVLDEPSCCNFRDAQHDTNQLKKNCGIITIRRELLKEINKRKNDEKKLNKDISQLRQKYDTHYYLLEEALEYASHDYLRGEYVIFYSKWDNCYMGGKIHKLNKQGYEIFNGRKLGIHEKVPFSNVFCEVSSLSKLFNVELKKEPSTNSANQKVEK